MARASQVASKNLPQCVRFVLSIVPTEVVGAGRRFGIAAPTTATTGPPGLSLSAVPTAHLSLRLLGRTIRSLPLAGHQKWWDDRQVMVGIIESGRQGALALAFLFAATLLAGCGGGGRAKTSAAAAAAAAPTLHFAVFARTDIRLTGVVWTGAQFLYIENTTNAIFTGDASGGPLRPFAALPSMSEETRCVVSPGGHGFPAGQIYCHLPDNRIFRVSGDGRTVRLFASLPTRATSDGMLAFDTVGRFGYGLIAATGRSGHPNAAGGVVYTIGPDGGVHRVGGYPGPGGADEVVVAPAGFGLVAGQALLTVDRGASGGTVVAIGPHGRTHTIARLPDGPNPIAAVAHGGASSAAAGGFYVADTNTRNAYFASAALLRRYAGDVLVGTELGARFFVIRPRGGSYQALELETDLPPASYNLEGATYVP